MKALKLHIEENETYFSSLSNVIMKGCLKINRLNYEDRRDVVQDVILAYLELSLERKIQIENTVRYFYKAGYNSALKKFKQSLKFEVGEYELEIPEEDEPETDPELLNNVVLVSNHFMINLNDNQRDIFRMHFFEGLKYKDISEKTGCTQDSVKSIVCVLKKKLRRFSYKFLTPYFYRD